jgi:hypothetical protein
MEDTRIAYGALCVWWSGIEDVGVQPSGVPCCPHCQGVLFQMDSPAEWWKGVDEFPNRDAAKAAYEAKGNRKAGF